ncbi:MAG: glycosyltransferase family 1 protein, partial [Anaerolineales bacterium]|nr:glycosyltransferase family 1 protein [Anaerolineales bacterium]
LCQGLQAAGHTVTLATNPTLCDLVEAHGVKSAPVGPPVDMGIEGARLLEKSFNNMWIGMLRVMRLGSQLVEAAYPEVLELSRNVDLIVTSDTGSGVAEAEKLGVPWISVTLQPARVPLDNPEPTLLQRLIWGAFGKLLVLPFNRSRKRLGAPPVTDITDMLSKRMILLPVSRHVAPPAPNRPTHVRQTGYWFARPQTGWQPPEDLLAFLEAGPKPIVVSLGVMSVSGKRARQSAEIVLAAIRQAGLRAIVQGWNDMLPELDIPESVYPAGSMPHAWLFDQASAIVHHGGFGTTAAALRAGVPSILIPHVIDQFYWGQRVFELNVGPQFISRGKLTAENLAAAITQAMEDEKMRTRAAELGMAIRAEPDGVTLAVAEIERAI